MTEQKTFEDTWERAENDWTARRFMLENWRIPQSELRALLDLENEELLTKGQRPRKIRFNKAGLLIDKGIQMRLTNLLLSIFSFGQEACFASVPLIGSRFGASKRTAQRALTHADRIGVLTIKPGVHHETSDYEIVWRRLFDWSPPFSFLPGGGVTRCHVRGDTVARRGDIVSRRGDIVSPKHELNASELLSETPMRLGDGFQKSSSRGRGSGGWNQTLTRYMLANVEQLETLFSEAQIRGWIPREPADALPALKLKFFTLARYCVRKSAPTLKASPEFIAEAGAVFTAQLKKATDASASAQDRAKAWLGSELHGDEEFARRMLFGSRVPDADLLAEEDRREQHRDKQRSLDDLKKWKRA